MKKFTLHTKYEIHFFIFRSSRFLCIRSSGPKNLVLWFLFSRSSGFGLMYPTRMTVYTRCVFSNLPTFKNRSPENRTFNFLDIFQQSPLGHSRAFFFFLFHWSIFQVYLLIPHTSQIALSYIYKGEDALQHNLYFEYKYIVC